MYYDRRRPRGKNSSPNLGRQKMSEHAWEAAPLAGTRQELQALRLLSTSAQPAQSLAHLLAVDESAIARLCALLVTRGLVIRVSTPSRDGEVAVALSTAGRRLVDDLIYRERSTSSVSSNPQEEQR
jgi:DNA-binding MarR family transcriptional regulator